jgi:hypothetical protein
MAEDSQTSDAKIKHVIDTATRAMGSIFKILLENSANPSRVPVFDHTIFSAFASINQDSSRSSLASASADDSSQSVSTDKSSELSLLSSERTDRTKETRETTSRETTSRETTSREHREREDTAIFGDDDGVKYAVYKDNIEREYIMSESRMYDGKKNGEEEIDKYFKIVWNMDEISRDEKIILKGIREMRYKEEISGVLKRVGTEKIYIYNRKIMMLKQNIIYMGERVLNSLAEWNTNLDDIANKDKVYKDINDFMIVITKYIYKNNIRLESKNRTTPIIAKLFLSVHLMHILYEIYNKNMVVMINLIKQIIPDITMEVIKKIIKMHIISYIGIPTMIPFYEIPKIITMNLILFGKLKDLQTTKTTQKDFNCLHELFSEIFNTIKRLILDEIKFLKFIITSRTEQTQKLTGKHKQTVIDVESSEYGIDDDETEDEQEKKRQKV